MEEIWKDINGYDGLYQVSNFGRVISNKINSPKLLKTNKTNKGYLFVVLMNGKRNYCRIHILVAKAFPEICGEWFEGCEVHHKDGNQLNNNADNLLICSKEQHNLLHNKSGKYSNRPVKYHQCDKVILQFDLQDNFIREWKSGMDIKRELGFDQSPISKCCNGVTSYHSAYGYKWKFKRGTV